MRKLAWCALLALISMLPLGGCLVLRPPEQSQFVAENLRENKKIVMGLSSDRGTLSIFPPSQRDARVDRLQQVLKGEYSDWFVVGICESSRGVCVMVYRGDWKRSLDVALIVANKSDVQVVRLDPHMSFSQQQSLFDSAMLEPVGDSSLQVWPEAGPPFRIVLSPTSSVVEVQRVDVIERLVIEDGKAVNILTSPSPLGQASPGQAFVFHPGFQKYLRGRESLPRAAIWSKNTSLESAKKTAPYVTLDMHFRPMPVVIQNVD